MNKIKFVIEVVDKVIWIAQLMREELQKKSDES